MNNSHQFNRDRNQDLSNKTRTNTNQINNALNAIQHKRSASDEKRDRTKYTTDEGETISTVDRAVSSVTPPASFKPSNEQVFLRNGLPNCDFIKDHFS